MLMVVLFVVVVLPIYQSRARLIGHLRDRSERCRIYYKLYVPMVEETLLQKLEEQDAQEARCLYSKGKSRYLAEIPVSVALGPLHMSASLLGIHPVHRTRSHYDWSLKAFHSNDGAAVVG